LILQTEYNVQNKTIQLVDHKNSCLFFFFFAKESILQQINHELRFSEERDQMLTHVVHPVFVANM